MSGSLQIGFPPGPAALIRYTAVAKSGKKSLDDTGDCVLVNYPRTVLEDQHLWCTWKASRDGQVFMTRAKETRLDGIWDENAVESDEDEEPEPWDTEALFAPCIREFDAFIERATAAKQDLSADTNQPPTNVAIWDLLQITRATRLELSKIMGKHIDTKSAERDEILSYIAAFQDRVLQRIPVMESNIKLSRDQLNLSEDDMPTLSFGYSDKMLEYTFIPLNASKMESDSFLSGQVDDVDTARKTYIDLADNISGLAQEMINTLKKHIEFYPQFDKKEEERENLALNMRNHMSPATENPPGGGSGYF